MDEKQGTVEPRRRDLVVTAALGFAGAGVALAVWPFISALGPGDTGEVDVTTVDLDSVDEGATQRVAWLGRAYLVRHRTDAEVARARVGLPIIDRYARNENVERMLGALDENRAVMGRPKVLVASAMCTKGDCMVRDANGLDDAIGWICPCCASRFDFSGRVVSGPAPENLPVPRYVLRNRHLVIGAR